MDDFLKEMADILDEEVVNEDDVLENFPSWDSLAVLSVISMADDKFGVVIPAQAIRSVTTIRALFELISGANSGNRT